MLPFSRDKMQRHTGKNGVVSWDSAIITNVKSSDVVNILGLLPAFQMACNTNNRHKGRAIELCQFFDRKGGENEPSTCLCLLSSKQPHLVRKLHHTEMSMILPSNVRRWKYYDIIAHADMDIMSYKQSAGRTAGEDVRAVGQNIQLADTHTTN